MQIKQTSLVFRKPVSYNWNKKIKKDPNISGVIGVSSMLPAPLQDWLWDWFIGDLFRTCDFLPFEQAACVSVALCYDWLIWISVFIMIGQCRSFAFQSKDQALLSVAFDLSVMCFRFSIISTQVLQSKLLQDSLARD